ncbi:trehalose operon repressor [Fundicoccus culcitae]|uniref:Trehalose operon repressor n=1 Tax=Fundicoccus culcitae TaxID=2969821 RepID=A0ABY5P2Z5_9LACT|nr:trehalose operon repressor [Fundicoccus culcitae]UUX33081.1 trehalose operon repressor [Fundicoccus culcitae]
MNKFEKIYLDLEAKIKDNTYQIGSSLPTENSLANTYGVSRETIRKTLKLLTENGYIQKQHGRRSVVLNHTLYSFPISGLISYKELQKDQGFKSETHLIKNELVSVPPSLCGKYDLAEDELFIHLIRARKINGETVIIDEDYIRQSIVATIPDEVALDSIYQYFEEELGLKIDYAKKEFTAEKANELDQELMHLKDTDYIINVESHVFLEDMTFFQLTSSRHHLERFRFSEFARRRHHF